LLCFHEGQDKVSVYADLLGCGQGQFPMRYLGIPNQYQRLTIVKWKLIDERLQKRLNSWKIICCPGVRLILVNSVHINMVLHMILFFLLPKRILHNLDYYRSRFFWQ
jgi:hypothetical protein